MQAVFEKVMGNLTYCIPFIYINKFNHLHGNEHLKADSGVGWPNNF